MAAGVLHNGRERGRVLWRWYGSAAVRQRLLAFPPLSGRSGEAPLPLFSLSLSPSAVSGRDPADRTPQVHLNSWNLSSTTDQANTILGATQF